MPTMLATSTPPTTVGMRKTPGHAAPDKMSKNGTSKDEAAATNHTERTTVNPSRARPRSEFTLALPPLPDEVTQAKNAQWIEEAGLNGKVRQRGNGRTAAVVHREMGLFKLAFDAMVVKLQELNKLTDPTTSHRELAELIDGAVSWRTTVLALTGAGRTREAVTADVSVMQAGARQCMDMSLKNEAPETSAPELPEDETQAENGQWIKKMGAEKVIKQRGEGRTISAVRKDMGCFKLGWDVVAKKLQVLVPPEVRKESIDAHVRDHFDCVGESRKAILPLTGKGRTLEAVLADITIAIAGARVFLERAFD